MQLKHRIAWRAALLVLVLLAVLALFGIYSAVFLSTNWVGIVRDVFLERLTQYITLLTAALLFALVLYAKLVQLKQAHTPSGGTKLGILGWFGGVMAALLVFGALIVIVNPRGQYGTDHFVHWVNPSRGDKPPAFLELTETPDVVVSGSSRAFTIQPERIQEQTGLTAFNFSVDSGKIDDVLLQAHFMEATGKFPHVLLVEIREGLLPNPTYTAQFSSPLMFPYMTLETALLFLKNRFDGLFSLQQATESVFVLQYMRDWTTLGGWQFAADGGADIAHINPSPESVEESIDWEAANTSGCGQFPPQGYDATEEFIQITEQHHSSVIFYLPPMPTRVYDVLVRNNERYETCYARLMTAMDFLQSKYANVHFLDYSDVTAFAGLTTYEGFIDGRHMTIEGNNRVVDAAAATILEAYELSQNAR
jgi:hypothetical protein